MVVGWISFRDLVKVSICTMMKLLNFASVSGEFDQNDFGANKSKIRGKVMNPTVIYEGLLVATFT